MADLTSVLSRIPGLAGWLAADQLRQQQGQEGQVNTLNKMKLVEVLKGQQREKKLSDILSQTQGDPQTTIPVLLKHGFVNEAEKLHTLLPKVVKPETPSSDMKNAAAIADNKGFARNTPEWKQEFIAQMELQTKRKGTNITNILPGEKQAVDVPKFRSQVQDTIKPYISTSDAADTSISMLNLAIQQNNPTAYQGSRVQLAKAFGDSQITGAEIKAAGGDPSIWGSLKDSASTLFTGTPSKDTMFAMKRTLTALKKVAETKGKKEIEIQKRIARNSGIKDIDVETIFDFPQFDAQSSGNGSPQTAEDLLRARGLIK